MKAQQEYESLTELIEAQKEKKTEPVHCSSCGGDTGNR